MDYCVPLGIPYTTFAAWSDSDRAYALAWNRDQAATCRHCGTRPDEWHGERDAYIADSVYCPGCAAIALHQDNMPQQNGRTMPGFKTVLKLKSWWEREQAAKATRT